MKIFMIGGTGLLGCEAATTLIKRGHQVKSVALPPLPEGAPIPKEMELVSAISTRRRMRKLSRCSKAVIALSSQQALTREKNSRRP